MERRWRGKREQYKPLPCIYQLCVDSEKSSVPTGLNGVDSSDRKLSLLYATPLPLNILFDLARIHVSDDGNDHVFRSVGNLNEGKLVLPCYAFEAHPDGQCAICGYDADRMTTPCIASFNEQYPGWVPALQALLNNINLISLKAVQSRVLSGVGLNFQRVIQCQCWA